MTEVVINTCFGGFGLSDEATLELAKRKGITIYPTPSHIDLEHGRTLDNALIVHYYKVPPEQYQALYEECKAAGSYKALDEKDWYFSERETPRDDPDLVALVKEWGERANDRYSNLEVVEVPDDVEWTIAEYDGNEHVAEAHRTWR